MWALASVPCPGVSNHGGDFGCEHGDDGRDEWTQPRGAGRDDARLPAVHVVMMTSDPGRPAGQTPKLTA